MRKAAGTTLMELLTTIAIVAVVATLATPGLRTLQLDSSRTTAVNGLLHGVFLARSEAIKRGQVVSLCPASDGRTCDRVQSDWSVGWIVFVNDDRDDPPEHDPGEELLARFTVWPGGSIISNRRGYSFRPATQGVVNGTLVFCDQRGAAHARSIIISHTGRPRVAQLDSDGKPLRCPSG